jgi:Ca-activated chloride channel family protein
MDLLWPGFLALFGLVPLLVGAYLLALRRRRRYAVRYSSLSLVRVALPRASWLRRHLPFALFALAVASLVFALVRPVARLVVPAGQTVVILAIDVSRSMCSTDIAPNRLEAAKVAAQSFIDRQNPNTQVGVVAFAGFAQLVQPPTTDRDALRSAIAALVTARRTAIGSGLLAALDAIAEVDDGLMPGIDTSEPVPPPAEEHVPHIVVLLTDGVSNTGPFPLVAAQHAAARGVRVYTIGFGTESETGSIPFCGDPGFGGSGFGGGGFGGGFRRGIDEVTLRQVADLTGGNYYAASSAGELESVFRELPVTLITRVETLEITFIFATLGALLAALALGLALRWNPLP